MAGKKDAGRLTPLKAIRQAERQGRVPSDERLPKQQVVGKGGKLEPEKRASSTLRKGEAPRKRGASNAEVRTGQQSTAGRKKNKGK